MKKQLVAFGISLGILATAVTSFVVWKNWPDYLTPSETDSSSSDLLSTEKNSEGTVDHSRPVGFEQRLRRGKGFLNTGDFAEAEAEFAAAAKLSPETIEPVLRLAESQIRQRNIAAARTNLDAARAIEAENPRIEILGAIADIREDKFPAADERLQKISAAEANFWQGLMASFYDRREEARSKLAPLSDSASHAILMAYEEYDGYPDSTKEHLDTLLARAFNEIGEYELAIAKIKPALANDPDYRDAWILLGYAEFARGNFDVAKQAWSTAYALDSGKPETQYFLGLVNFELENFEEAARFLNLARENGFSEYDLDKKLADSLYELGSFPEAASIYSQVLASDPNAEASDYIRPVYIFLEQLGNGNQAWQSAAEALERFPADPAAANLAGWVSLNNGYLDEAEAQLRTALRIDPAYAWAYFNLGRVELARANREAALENFQKAYELDQTGDVAPLAAESYNQLIAEK